MSPRPPHFPVSALARVSLDAQLGVVSYLFAVARAPYFGIQRACFVFCVGVCVLWLLASGFVALQTKESKFRA
jgi:hypothetical protein